MKKGKINEKYTWDLTKFCKSDEEWYEKIKLVEKMIPKFLTFKGKLSDPKQLLKYYELGEEYYMLVSKLAMYVSCNLNTDLTSSKYTEMENLLDALDNQHSVNNAFSAPELLSYSDEYFDKLINDKRFKNHAFALENLRRSRPHILSEKEEKILTASTTFSGEFSKIFHSLVDSNFNFPKVKDNKGKLHTLTQSNFTTLLTSADRVLRKNAFNALYEKYIEFSDTIANNYIASLKANWFYASTSNFKSVLEEHLFPDNINPKVYYGLIENVHNNLPLLHKYFSIKKKLLGIKDFTYYDLYLPTKKPSGKITFEESMEILYKALAVLGDNYVQLLKRSVKERWMDVFPKQNKRSGAYQSDAYGTTPVVLLNFEGQVDDVFTIAHELGHAMHSYHSNEAQPLSLSGYTIFLAEVASTVNEVLLLKYLYNNATSKQEKIYYLEHYLQMFKGTIFRQTMFAEFEEFANGLIEKNLPISKKVLCDFYSNLNKKYQGKNVKHNSHIDYEWLRIPHFYGSYYVYKYATGLTTAVCLASNIYNKVDGALEKYYNFLKAGGSNYSVEILKSAGVNLETNQPYEIAFNEMKWAVDELEKLTKK